MVTRVQLLLWLFVLCVGFVIAQVPSNLKLTLYHQLVYSDSAKDISPRGIISYDTSRSTASLTEQSELIDFASGKGIYRIGLYDSNKKQLGPAAFANLDNVKGPVTEEITLYFSPENVLYHISYVLKPSTSQSTIVNVVPYNSIPNGPNPVLNPPVVVNADGKPPEEEIEKTFLQKYWMYLLPIAILALTSGGGGGGAE